MIGLLQRVRHASVRVGDRDVSGIGRGILVFIGVERGDSRKQAERLLQRLLGYRIFPDQNGRMNRSLVEIGGGLLLVPQFTLAADTKKGMRPSFTPAADPDKGKYWYEYLVESAGQRHGTVYSGVFGADMQVGLVNDGPVTFRLQV